MANNLSDVCNTTFLSQTHLNKETSEFDPKEIMTPSNFKDITPEEADIIIKAVAKVPSENILLLFLGDPIKYLFTGLHKLDTNEFFTKSGKKISIVMFTPPPYAHGIHKSVEHIKQENFDTSFKADFVKQLNDFNVSEILNIHLLFPLSPVFGIHPNPFYEMPAENKRDEFQIQNEEYKKVNESFEKERGQHQYSKFGLRHQVFYNAINACNVFVNHEGPLFINSRITSVCYRSFKFILDMRTHAGKTTETLVGYTDRVAEPPISCDKTPLFPQAFEKCNEEIFKDETKIKKYYITKHRAVPPRTIQQVTKVFNKLKNNSPIRKYVIEKGKATNKELQNAIPKGGTRKRKRYSKRKSFRRA